MMSLLFWSRFSSYDQNRLAIDKAGQMVLTNLHFVARIMILTGVRCPRGGLANSSALLRIC